MENRAFFKNKLYLALLGSWVLLYILQAVLALAGVLGGVFLYILAVAFALVTAAMLIVGFVRREKLFFLICGIYSLFQVILFLLSIPAMITGRDLLPRVLQCLLHVPGYGLLSGAFLWPWIFILFWGVVLFGTWDSVWNRISARINDWWQGLFGRK